MEGSLRDRAFDAPKPATLPFSGGRPSFWSPFPPKRRQIGFCPHAAVPLRISNHAQLLDALAPSDNKSSHGSNGWAGRATLVPRTCRGMQASCCGRGLADRFDEIVSTSPNTWRTLRRFLAALNTISSRKVAEA